MAAVATVSAGAGPDTPRPIEHTPPPGQPGSTDLRDLLARDGALTSAEVAELLLSDQMARWGRGERIPAESYLQLHPALTAANPDAFDLIFNEFVLREERGEAPAPTEYLWRFPQFAERLRRQLEVHQGMLAGEGPGTPAEADASCLPAASENRGDWPFIDGYEILDQLGRGGMGVVYKARHLKLKRLVALKLILAGAHADEPEVARFQREAEMAARLQHDNIVRIFEIGVQGGLPYLSMELVEGDSLARRLREGPLPARQAAQLVEVLARAIHYAHGQGIVHRDLKPANVLLARGAERGADGVETRDGAAAPTPTSRAETGNPKITDFGLAKRLDGSMSATQTGLVVGTASYMAPEQAAGQARDVGPAADVYALGSILYEMLTGRPPFQADNVLDTLAQVRGQQPVPPSQLQPKVPRDLVSVAVGK